MPAAQMNTDVMNELFEQRKENLDRFTQLLNISLIVGGFYVAIASFMIERTNNENLDSLINGKPDLLNLKLCFCFLIIAFAIIIINMFITINYNKLIENNGLIIFREDHDQQQYNMKLFKELNTNTHSYIIACASIAFSVFSLLNYFMNILILILLSKFVFAFFALFIVYLILRIML